MISIVPAALAGLVLLAGPLLVHLLVRRHARHVLFPAMRFVPAVHVASVRMRRPSDAGLLLLRLAIVAAAVAAAAQPLLVTPARQRGWASRIARAVIVDTSASVPAAVAAGLAAQEMSGVFRSRRFQSPDLRDALDRASVWLETAPSARREIAIVSDFQRGAIDAADLGRVPPSTGVRLVRAGPPSAAPRLAVPIDGWRDGRWQAVLEIDSSGTRVRWQRAQAGAPPGLTVLAPAADADAAERAARAAVSFGVPAADPSRPIEIVFVGGLTRPDSAPATSWIASAAIALSTSPLLSVSGARVDVRERSGVMVARAALPASSGLAPLVIRAVLLATRPEMVDREQETASIDDSALARWRRAPVAVPGDVRPDSNDGRWLWVIAVALLVVESVLRRRHEPGPMQDVHANAA